MPCRVRICLLSLILGAAGGAEALAASRSRNVALVAGNGGEGARGVGGPAAAAELGRWANLTCDRAGTLYVADGANHRVLRIDVNGQTITSIAGTGRRGTTPERGQATGVPLGRLHGIAIDANGTVYVADPDARCVRRIHRHGIVDCLPRRPGDETVGPAGARGPSPGPRSLAVGAQRLVTVSWGRPQLWGWDLGRMTPLDLPPPTLVGSDDDGIPVANARLAPTTFLAVDARGRVFLSEPATDRVRRIDADGTISTVAGSGRRGYDGDGGPGRAAALQRPMGVAVDADGHLYIADAGNHRIRRLDATTGQIETIAGNGSGDCTGATGEATAVAVCPQFLAVDGGGRVYFTSDVPGPRIYRLDGTDR